MKDLSIKEKLELLSDSAKYDVACTSSGVTRKGNGTGLGNSLACGICHSFSADGRCISLLKVLYTNHCIYDCKYCMNRASNDIPRTSFTPEELTNLTIQFYRRNYIEGLFLSSGIYPSPNKTMEQILQVVTLLRETHQFHGYIHIKAIPGTDPSLIDRIGWYVDRMSINMELPTANSLHQLAPHKSRSNILTPMRTIQQLRDHNRDYYGERLIASSESIHKLPSPLYNEVKEDKVFYKPTTMKVGQKRFVPAGQSTQFIIGASEDTDYEIIKTTEALYNKFDLKRVFYSAFMNINKDSTLPDTTSGPPLLREHRLYQADWLLRFYQFKADEIISSNSPNLNTLLDPKCNYALNHMELFPIEITTASYHDLLRIPGIGVTSARRIIAARKETQGTFLDFPHLKKMGVVLKRAQYFITCNGKTFLPLKMNQSFILANLLGIKEKLPEPISKTQAYEQLTLFPINIEVEQALSPYINT